MKVPRRARPSRTEGPHLRRPHRHPFEVLQRAHDLEDPDTDENGVGLLEQVWADGDVDQARLVLEGQKQEPPGRAGPLTTDHCTGHGHAFAIGQTLEIDGSRNTATVEILSIQRHRMRPNRDARADQIGLHALLGTHLGQWRNGCFHFPLGVEQRATWAPGLFHLPKRAPPREAEAVERPDLGQALQLVAMQRHTIDEVLERHETLRVALSHYLLPRCLPQAGHVHEPEPNGAIFLE